MKTTLNTVLIVGFGLISGSANATELSQFVAASECSAHCVRGNVDEGLVRYSGPYNASTALGILQSKCVGGTLASALKVTQSSDSQTVFDYESSTSSQSGSATAASVAITRRYFAASFTQVSYLNEESSEYIHASTETYSNVEVDITFSGLNDCKEVLVDPDTYFGDIPAQG